MSDHRQRHGPITGPLSKFIVLTVLLLGLPLWVVWLDGREVLAYLQLPPEHPTPVQPPFSWWRFVGTLLLILLALAPFLLRLWRCRRTVTTPPAPRPLPWWGYLGLLILIASWVLAWNRFEWAAPVQQHTFTPIWLGYIVLINAMVFRRAGTCLLTARPALFLALFPVSSLFWWFFEYLNRFVQNWQYSGGGEIGPWEYLIAASLPFSTVLPAVLGTRDYLATFPKLHAGLERGWRPPPVPRRALAIALLSAAVLGLLGLPLWPLELYPLVWIAPLFIVIGLQALLGERTLLDPSLEGDWRPLWLAAVAALMCGFLWELWNWHSVSRWEYIVPYVGRFHLFEMPILGYAGYLPFGLECLAAATLFFGARRELLYGLTLPTPTRSPST